MHVTKVFVRNYRALQETTVTFGPGVTVVVGNNETGKSTLLEAMHLALTGLLGGRPIRPQLHPYLFNRKASLDFAAKAGKAPPPEILIEVHLNECRELAALMGANNEDRKESIGVSMRIALKDEYKDEFRAYINAASTAGRDDTDLLAVEYFDVFWRGFDGNPVSHKLIPLKSQLIDPASLDPRRGTGRYISTFVRELPPDEKVKLAVAYRSMKLAFQAQGAVQALNKGLRERGKGMSKRTLSVAMDMTSSNDWEQGVSPMLDDIPFDLVGKGEQAAVRIWLAMNARKDHSDLVMVEEPENHLSFARLNVLLAGMEAQLNGRQLIVTTHSSFVLNKLGLDDLLLFNAQGGSRLTALETSTISYFKRLPGHDTLRLVLADRVILVEGPSDELVVQRAYRDTHGRLPIQDGVDVLAVGSLAFPRYLELAAKLGRTVSVVTDNDGDPEAVRARLGHFEDLPRAKICYSDDASLPTLEPQIVGCNELAVLSAVMGGKAFKDKDAAKRWMVDKSHKTEAALQIFESDTAIKFPEYILRAVR